MVGGVWAMRGVRVNRVSRRVLGFWFIWIVPYLFWLGVEFSGLPAPGQPAGAGVAGMVGVFFANMV